MEWGDIDRHLLTTKLTIPPLYRDRVIPRERLYEQLDGGVLRPILLVAAPAGFGKTTLIADWLQHRELSAAWVSLEKADNELIRFWRYVITALCRQHNTICKHIEISQELSLHVEAILAALINALLDLTEDVLLVLDDYQVIANPAIHQSMAFFLEHLPPQLHVLMITRSDPPLTFARLRVQGKLTELRAADLCLTFEEAQSFLNQLMDLSLTDRQIEDLCLRTEGWMAGMQLAALSLNARDDASGVQHFIDTFTGTNRYILPYLSDEVLYHQSEDIQAFLLSTSILECLTPALCDAIAGRSDSQELLERLAQDNLLLFPLDEPVGLWQVQDQPLRDPVPICYRYHCLFADLLRYRLHQQHPEQETELHFRASVWYEQHDMTSAAIHHALLSGSAERAAHLLENAAWSCPVKFAPMGISPISANLTAQPFPRSAGVLPAGVCPQGTNYLFSSLLPPPAAGEKKEGFSRGLPLNPAKGLLPLGTPLNFVPMGISPHPYGLVAPAQAVQLYCWLVQIPASVFAERPVLSYMRACIAMTLAKMDEYEYYLQQAQEIWQAEHDRPMMGRVHALRSSAARLRDDPFATRQHVQQVLNLVTADDLDLRGCALVNLGSAYLNLGELAQAREAYEEGARLVAQGRGQAPISANLKEQDVSVARSDRKGREGTSPSSTHLQEMPGKRCVEDGFTPSRPLRSPGAHHAPPPRFAPMEQAQPLRCVNLLRGDTALLEGDLETAVQIYHQMVSDTSENGIWYTISAHIRLSSIYLEWNDLIHCMEHWHEVAHLVEDGEKTHPQYRSNNDEMGGWEAEDVSIIPWTRFLLGAQLAWYRGEFDQGLNWLDLAEQCARGFGENRMAYAEIVGRRVQFLLALDNVSVARSYLENALANSARPDGMFPYEKEAYILARARLSIAQKRPGVAITLLEEMLPTVHTQGRRAREIIILLLLTLAYHAEGCRDGAGPTQQALHALGQALRLGEMGNYIRTFVDEGPVLSALLGEFYHRYQKHINNDIPGISMTYLGTLLAAVGQDVPSSWSPAELVGVGRGEAEALQALAHKLQEHEVPLLEMLSEREYSVLRLVSEGLSNQEIARNLVVTVSTVKTHLNNIYAKFHVHTRLQAVTKAYDLGLLNPGGQAR